MVEVIYDDLHKAVRVISDKKELKIVRIEGNKIFLECDCGGAVFEETYKAVDVTEND